MTDDPKTHVIKAGALSMCVCVPDRWADHQIENYALRENPCSESGEWHIRREHDPALRGKHEREQCLTYPENVHVWLDP